MMTIIKTSFLFSLLVPLVSGHGHMYSPKSRNWVAHTEGAQSGQPGVPVVENCPHCNNRNPLTNGWQVCGQSVTRNYNGNGYVDSTGAPMEWQSQQTLQAGQEFTVKSYLDTHHAGHMELKACVMEEPYDTFVPTQECFDDHPLEFVRDNGQAAGADNDYLMPKDDFNPVRGMYAGGQGGGWKDFDFTYTIPSDIYGERVLLQWRYITANDCSPPGYADYWRRFNIPDSYWTANVNTCTPPYPQDGTRSTSWPEQFFNCAEVEILSGNPTVSPAPSASPTTGEPTVTAMPTINYDACCSQNHKDCITWHESEESCLNAGEYWMLKPPEDLSCAARWAGCTGHAGESDYCCPGLDCVGDVNYAQCVYNPNPTTPAPVPPATPGPTPNPTEPTTAPPTNRPTNHPTPNGGGGGGEEGCCTQNFKNCINNPGWCGTTQADCMGCGQYWSVEGDQSDTNCLPRNQPCVSQDDCCLGLTCKFEHNWWGCKV